MAKRFSLRSLSYKPIDHTSSQPLVTLHHINVPPSLKYPHFMKLAQFVFMNVFVLFSGEHSKIKMTTRNVFIECTATDLHKASVVLDTLVCMFSEYCALSFTYVVHIFLLFILLSLFANRIFIIVALNKWKSFKPTTAGPSFRWVQFHKKLINGLLRSNQIQRRLKPCRLFIACVW